MLGVIVNAAAVIVGGLIGLLVKKGIPQRFSTAIMAGIGLCVMYIGISGALEGNNLIILVVSLVLGAVTGTALKIEERLNSLGEKIEKKFAKNNKDGETNPIAQGFVTASLLFCVGAMSIVGSIQSGMTGNHEIIYTKATLDFIAAAMLAVTLGVGVILSSATILVYQGALVLLAQLISPLLENQALIAEMNCAGSIIIIALGLNLLGITKIKVANYLPAIIFAPTITALLLHFNG